MKQSWQLLAKETLYNGPHGAVVENWKMKTHRGEALDFTIRKGKDFIILFALTEKQEVLVAHEYFPANQKRLVSFVGGIIDDGYDHRTTVEKELLEETGCRAGEFVYLGSLSRGKYNSGIMHSYLATGVKKVQEQTLEPSEDIEIEFVPLPRFRGMLARGEVGCVFEVACAYQALDYLGRL